ncbi:hypothetical protein M409DRAFT_26057 [Zasmidium cellare ATCC 36951]|uniref:Uncharacterized protein n=1 Tax=Zasmidium cellare ATCC 36951 TaxID=1080233 RepID=A0A6A6C8H1_ZASCE|nr:uncharacterized protein M409DRAFT_26057 [Zasmidium cellare ATCC 36951]KAF2163444.1 hypothetical protein M409DRAFT_26057 [Zasmidium cellare ATCC 36951]
MTLTLLQWMGPTDHFQINTYTGLTSGLLLLINQITDLEYPSNSKLVADHHRIAADIKTSLEGLRQDVPPNLLFSTTVQLSASAEAYRLACLLYLHHKVASIRARIAVRTTSLSPLFSQSEVLHLTSQILSLLEDNPGLTRTVANRLWPIFMAGSSANDDFLRLRVLNLFEQIEKDRRFWNVAPVRMMILKIWRHRDIHVDEPVVSTRKYKKAPAKEAEYRQGSGSDWDCILEMMANFTWSLT